MADARTPDEVKTLFFGEMLRRGLLVVGTRDLTTAVTSDDTASVAAAYAETVDVIVVGLERGDFFRPIRKPDLRPPTRLDERGQLKRAFDV